MHSVWVSEEDTAVVQFWPGSELDIRGSEVQTWQHMSVPQRKICYLRRISMVRDTRTNKERLPSSSPLNYTKCWSLLDHCHFRLPLPSSLMSIKVILRVTLTHRLCLAGFRKTAICCNRALFAFWSSLSISLSPEHRRNAPWLWELQGNRPELWRRGHVG